MRAKEHDHHHCGKRGVEDARQAAWAYVRPSAKEKAPETADDDKNSRPGVIGRRRAFPPPTWLAGR